MELGQFWKCDRNKAQQINRKVIWVVLGVKTSEEEPET